MWKLDSITEKVMAFEQWCYQYMLTISWRDKVKNAEVLRKIAWQNRMSTEVDALLMLESKINGAKWWAYEASLEGIGLITLKNGLMTVVEVQRTWTIV